MTDVQDTEFESVIQEIKGDDLKDLLRNKNTSDDLEDRIFAMKVAEGVKKNQQFEWVSAIVFGGILLIAVMYIVASSFLEVKFLSNVRDGRAFLLIMIVVTTIAFGGTMLYSSLFGSAVTDKRRAQGREIFVFFSGTFGTVVGFYFASATAEIQSDPAEPLLANVALQENGELLVSLSGGAQPYEVEIQYGDGEAQFSRFKDDPAKFSLKPSANFCPAESKILVMQSGGTEATPFNSDLSARDLRSKGWTACVDNPSATPTGEPDPDTESDAPDA